MKTRSFLRRLADFAAREDGPTAVEYAVMLALIVAVCAVGITQLGTSANSAFGSVYSSSGGLSGNWTGSTGDTISFSGSGGSFTADGGTITGNFTSTGGNNYSWTDSAGAKGTATVNGNTISLTNTENGATERFTKN